MTPSSRCAWGSASTWKVIASAIGANRPTISAGRATIRCTSTTPPAAWIGSATARAKSGPTVRFGTKWPSITSTWAERTPASIRPSSWAPSRSMSADITDGRTSGACVSGALMPRLPGGAGGR